MCEASTRQFPTNVQNRTIDDIMRDDRQQEVNEDIIEKAFYRDCAGDEL